MPVAAGQGMRAAMRGGIVIAALLAGTVAHAQDNITVVPTPGVERYSLPPGNSQTTPTPTPLQTPSLPTPTLTPAPPPSVVPNLQIPRTTPTPAPPIAGPVTRAPAPTTAPNPIRAPAVSATPTPEPAVTPPTGDVAAVPIPEATAPAPIATDTAVAPPPVAPVEGPPTWLWWLIAAVVIAAGGFFVWQRFTRAEPEAIAYAPEPEPLPTPSPPAQRGAGAAPVSAVSQPAGALTLDFRPQRLWTRGPDAFLAFEMVVTNTGPAPVDTVRPVISLVSGGPHTAAAIAEFNASAPTMPGGEPFALDPGETRSIVGELTLHGDSMHVTAAADRELIVPIALVSLGWRAGVSPAHVEETFIIGTGDASAPRLGPIWVDRAGLVYAKLDARRFTPWPR